MATAEEIMLTFFGKDEVSNVASNINKNVQSMGSTASAAMNNLNSGALQVSSGLESVVSSLNAGKSASETIFGTSSKAETNSVLLKLMSSTEEAATKLNAHVDDVTNSSLVSMQSLIPAMNAFKTATGATDDEIYNATESMANFGAKVLAQTGSTDLAEQAMMDLSKGIKGACASLDQYGITTDALKNTGLWSGEEDDIAGYMAAVAELTGDTKELMQTNEGLDKQIEKAFSSAGKKLGNEFLPSIKDAKRALIDLNSATGGGLFAGILGVSAVADTASQWGMTITNISNGVSNLRDGVSGLKSVWDTVTSAVKGTQAAVEGVADATNTASNISDMAAGGASVAGGLADSDAITSTITPGDAVDLADTIKNNEKFADDMGDVIDSVDDISDASKDLKKAEQGVDGLTDVATMIPAGVGAEAAASGAEAATASAGFAGLGASITSMLATLLTIAAVVAVMIPVVVALAAEALIFIRALASVFEALNFDQLDLSDDIDGLKQIGTAIWELCKAMAGLVVTAWLTLIYQGISAIMMFNDPIEIAVNELKKTAELVAGFKNINIDESVPSNLQSLSTSLGAVSKAMSSLSSVGVSVLLGSILTLNGYLGTLSDNLGVAKTELTKSAETINDMADLEDIDEGVVSKLGKVTSALGNVGDAMSSLTSVNWDINMGNLSNLGGIFGTITQHLGDAKDEIIKAAPILNEFSSMQSIDDGVGEKLKKVSEALKSTADAMKNLSSIQDNVGSNILENLTNISSITTALASAKSILFNAAEQLNSLNGLPTISDDVKTKISSIGSTAATVINCLKPLTTIAGDEAINSSNIVSKIQQARYAISNTATHLASLSGIATIPDNLPTLLNKVGSSAATVINTLKPLNSIASAEVNSQAITSKIAQARYAISNTATHLGSLAGIATIPDTLPTLLNKVGTSATQVTTAVQHLNTIPVVTASIANVTLAVATIKSAINQLNSLAGTSLNGGISSLLSSVTSAVNQTKTTLYSMSGGFYSAGVNIGQSITNGVRAGLSGLAGVVSSMVSSAVSSAVGVATSGGARLGQALTTGFKTNLKLADAMSTEMNYVVQAVNNGISSAKQAAESGAQDVVAAFKSGIETGSPGAMAWATYDEMGYIRDFIVSEGKHVVTAAKRLGQNIVTGFGDPSLNIGGLTDPLTSGQFNMGSLGIMETMLSTAPNTAGIGQNVEIHVHEGAVQLDARNLTTRESKQVMINALEGLDAISNVNIRGIGG